MKSAIVLAALAGSLFGQWPTQKTAGIPRLPDGKPDLNAPAPKAADGHIDFSGIWEFSRPRPAPGAAPAKPPAAAPPPDASLGLGPRPTGVNQFFNIGSTLKDG